MLEIILADLRERFGDKVLLSPEDLVSVINKSEGQQANERSQGVDLHPNLTRDLH